MSLEEKVLSAQLDNSIRNDIIKEYKNYISSCAKKTIGRYITDQDDEMSIAMIAFDEAITKYDNSKGSFLNYANIIIKNKLIDFIRKEYKNSKTIPFSGLNQTDDDGDEIKFDIEDSKSDVSDVKLEIDSLTDELHKYDISFFELPKSTPKSKKTKESCFKIIKHIIQNPILINEIKINGIIPIKSILESVNVSRKIVERHRKYIITSVIVLTGGYDIIAEYFKGVKEV